MPDYAYDFIQPALKSSHSNIIHFKNYMHVPEKLVWDISPLFLTVTNDTSWNWIELATD